MPLAAVLVLVAVLILILVVILILVLVLVVVLILVLVIHCKFLRLYRLGYPQDSIPLQSGFILCLENQAYQ